MKKLLLFSLLWVTFSTALMAQNRYREGFIVTHDKDTVYGELEYRSNLYHYGSCWFRKDGETKTYGPDELLSYKFLNDKGFVSGIAEDQFVEILVAGKLSVYKGEKHYYIDKEGENVQKLEINNKYIDKDGKSFRQDDNRWKGIIIYFISDCNSNAPGIQRMKLNDQNLIKIAVKYNQCSGADYFEMKEDKAWIDIDYGISGGYTKVNLIPIYNNYQDIEPRKLMSQYMPVFGLAFVASSPRFYEKLAFQAEVNYQDLGLVMNETEFELIELKLKTISVPLTLNYSFIHNKNYSAYIQGGIQASRNIHGNVTKTYKQSGNESIFGNYINRFQSSIVGGLGVIRNFNGFKAGAVFKYSQSSILNNKSLYGRTYQLQTFSFSVILLKD